MNGSGGGSSPRSPSATFAAVDAPAPSIRGPRVTVLAILKDEGSRALFPKVVRDRLLLTDDLAEALHFAEQTPPDVAFVEIGIGDGAGLALVHHLKAVCPGVSVYALSSRRALEAAANAVALGGAGLIMMPVGGDEILSAIGAVKGKLADKAMRAELERASLAYSRAAGWMARVAALAAAQSRVSAAEQFLQVVVEATGAGGAAIYLSGVDRPNDLSRAAVSPTVDRSPPVGVATEVLEYARKERLLVVPLSVGSIKAGHILLAHPEVSVNDGGLPRSSGALPPPKPLVDVRDTATTTSRPEAPASNGPRLDGIVKLLATQAASAFALLAERERTGGATIKDPASSAYSFAYYVDVAGREIDKARRYGRRFAVATVAFEPRPDGQPPFLSHAEMADQLLKAARDTDVLAHVDEHEFHLLMPETDGLGAHAARRRVLARLAERGGKAIPPGLLVGVSTFPHDGADLSQLLRVARRRAEATRSSLVRRLGPDQGGLVDVIDALGWELEVPPAEAIYAARSVELSLTDAAALTATVVGDALRGGPTLLVVAHHDDIRLGAAVRHAVGLPRDGVTLHAVDIRGSAGTGPSASRGSSPMDNVEALAVLAEHGTYALVGRSEGGFVRGVHSADPLLADVLAERVGRAAGLRLFT